MADVGGPGGGKGRKGRVKPGVVERLQRRRGKLMEKRARVEAAIVAIDQAIAAYEANPALGPALETIVGAIGE